MPSRTTTGFQEAVENFMQFTGAEKPKPNAVFIAVMGITGSGKSSFISAVTGRDVKIGHELSSCTSSVDIFHCEMEGYNVYFIDTPGFDDTNRSDLEILNVISNFFSVSFANRNLLNGLIYLHQISDPRMGRTRRLNIDMFKALCGEDAFPNVAVVTSMWSTDESSREFEKQIEREEQLSAEYLADVLSAEGLLRRVKSKDKTTIDVSSAQEIFQELFDLWKDDQITLDIQHELVNSGLRIGSTAAGKVLSSHLDKTYSAELSQLRSATKHASYAPTIPNEATDALDDDEQKALQASLAQLRADKQGMDLDLVQVHVQERKRFIAELTAIEARWRDELAEREREQAEHERMLAKRLQQQEQQEQQQQQFMAAFVREVAAQQQQQWREEQQRQREEKYREEVERMRKDLEEMRAEIQAKTETAEKAKRAWVDPLIEGAVGGGMQLVGGLITAGMLCVVQ